MELLEYWKIVRKRFWLIALLMLLGGLGGYIYRQRQVPQYSSTTTLFLNPAVASPLLPFDVSTTNRVQSLANTYAEFLRTRSFAELVRDKIGTKLSEQAVLRSLETQYVEDTQFFRITATHPAAETAQKLANTAAEVLITANSTRQQQIAAQGGQGSIQGQEQLNELQAALRDQLASTAEQINDVQGQLLNLEREGRTAEVDSQISDLRQQLRELQTLRVNVLTSLSQIQATLATQNSTAFNVDTAVVVDAAPLPALPLSRRTLEYALLGVLAGLALGFGISLFLEYLDYTVKTPEVLDVVYGMPTQGVIGVVTDRAGYRHTERQLVTVKDPLSPTSEAFRALRTSVQAAGLKSPVRNLLVTSASPGEGKSFVTANLAVALAKNGSRVVLVDADLRKPTLHEFFAAPREPGFVDILVDPKRDLQDVLQQSEVPNLYLLPCGTMPPNPSELLGSSRAVEVMHCLQENADVVVYDSPPIATVTDAAVLAPHMDGVLQIVRAGATRIDMVRRSKAILEQVEARILGPVLNQVEVGDLGYYASYYYGYYRRDVDGGAQRLRWWRRYKRRKRGQPQPPSATLPDTKQI